MGNTRKRRRDYLDRKLGCSIGLELLAYTERAEYPVEHIFDLKCSNQLFQFRNRGPEMHRRYRHRELLLTPCLAEPANFGTGNLESFAVPCPRQYRKIRRDWCLMLVDRL